MFKNCTSILASLVFCLTPLVTFAQEAESSDTTLYVVDDLYTYLHAGPGRNYRILGSVTAGSKVTFVQVNTENGYTEVIDDKQRTGWIETQYLTDNVSLKESLEPIQQSLQEQTALNQDLKANNEQLNQELNRLVEQNAQLKQELDAVQLQNDTLQQQAKQQGTKAQIEWLTRGGVIGLGGTLLGAIVMWIIPRRRHRNDGWM